MRQVLRVVAFAAAWLLVPVAAHALERSKCEQYGGDADCWAPVVGPWKYSVCAEVGAFQSASVAECVAQEAAPEGSL
jgi:hypothetical protein